METKGNNNYVPVKDLAEGMLVDSIYALWSISPKQKKNGELYLQMKLGDATGKIVAVLWDNAEEKRKLLNRGDLVHIKAKVGSYNNEKQLSLLEIKPLAKDDYPPRELFLASSERAIEEMEKELQALITQISPPYQELIKSIFGDTEFYELFLQTPGGKQWHHPYLGGLLEHTLNVCQICLTMTKQYPALNSDLLLTGAILHDIGKVKEFTFGISIDYSDPGRLLGHTVMADEIICAYAKKIPQITEEQLLLLRHLVLSHHGETQDSPRRPMIPEAVIVHLADNLDAQTAAFIREVNRAKNLGKKWTDYVKLADRYIFTGSLNKAAVQSEETEFEEENEEENPTENSLFYEQASLFK